MNFSKSDGKMVRINRELLEGISPQFPNDSEAVNRIIAYVVRMNEWTLNQIKGTFSKNELMAMVDTSNGIGLDERTWGSKRMFLWGLEDGFKLEGLGEKWKVSFEEISEKVNSLSDSEFLFLHEEIWKFWNGREYGEGLKNLDEFVQKFLES